MVTGITALLAALAANAKVVTAEVVMVQEFAPPVLLDTKYIKTSSHIIPPNVE